MVLRGRAHFGLKENMTAEEDFRRAILADPKMDNARGAIGNCRIARGDLEESCTKLIVLHYISIRTTKRPDNLIRVKGQELSRLSH